MADRKLFYEDPALDHVDTSVVESGELEGKAWVRLAETVFYPEGGGQPADRGTIAGIHVLDVQSRGDEVLHFVERVPPNPRVHARIDALWRFDLRQQHSAQHLLTAVLADRHGLATTSFHLGDAYTAIEVSGPVPDLAALRGFEREVNERILEDRPVRTSWIDRTDVARQNLRSRGLPEGHTGAVRIVEIDGLDRNTCGGTHVTRLGEIQIVQLLGSEPARGGTRIRFLAGHRVLREIHAVYDREARLKEQLGTGPDEFSAALEAREAAKRLVDRRLRAAQELLAERLAVEIQLELEATIVRIWPGADLELLRAVAGRLAKTRPEALLVLIGSSGTPGEACFVVQSGPAGPADVAGEAALVAQSLAARGGGRGRFHQGHGGGLPGPAELERLLQALREARKPGSSPPD